MQIFQKINKDFSSSKDFVSTDITVGQYNLHILNFSSLTSSKIINDSIIKPIQNNTENVTSLEQVLPLINISGKEIVKTNKDIYSNLLSGSAIILDDNSNDAIICPCKEYEIRSINEPPTSAILKGPREGFTEDLNTNISLLRRRIKHYDFVAEEKVVGRYTNTSICLCYIKSIADKKLIKKLKDAISKIDIDGVVDSYYIQTLIEPKQNNIFPQVGYTEKPDVATSKILEGRIAIIVDGSPIVLTVPYVYFEDFQSGDDYYNNNSKATFTRLIRVLGVVLGVGLPGIYVAMQSFHYALLPVDFLITLLSSIEGISFPPLIEILFVLFLFEILNEASIRMPKYLGMALSIIGALVLGDTAVQAGIISSPSVMMVAISGITLYIVPNQVSTTSLLRLFFTVIGGVAGFYGLLVATVFTIAYMCSINAFDTPYMAPYAPSIKLDKKDGIFKKGLIAMRTRPESIPNKNKVRFNNGDK